ncbi:hypothetical protein Tco_0590787, partial [Tanacetum coccineum]
QNRRDLPKDTPIDRLEVLRYDIGKRSKVRMGIMPTETELTLEQTQQVTMEILIEPTSNKLLVGDMGDSIWITRDTEYQSWSIMEVIECVYEKPLDAKVLDIKFLCSKDIKSMIQIHDHRLTKGTVKNSQDNKALRREVMPALKPVRTMPNTRSGASRIREGVNKQINHRLAGALRPCGAARNREPLIRDEGKLEEVSGNRENRNGGNRNGGIRNRGNRNGWNRNGGNGNGGTGNGNGNKGGYGYNFEGYMPARECTYQDFLKFQPLNFNGTEGVVGLTRWFEKMETVFHISNCPEKYQVKYASCTLLNSALTWWNSHKRMIGIEAAYAISWAELMKMVPSEEDKVERFVGGLPDNIQGNVIAAEPTQLQDAIRIANNLMDQNLKGYARSAENKRRLENNPRDNRGQQPVFKRQNVGGRNVATTYTAENN